MPYSALFINELRFQVRINVSITIRYIFVFAAFFNRHQNQSDQCFSYVSIINYVFTWKYKKLDLQFFDCRDSRGFALKFYTEEGIWDLVGNNTPLLLVKDSLLFPSLIHVQKRNPVTFLKDNDMFWDFLSLRPESTHQLMFLFGDRGIPDGYRHMHGFGANTFKLVNKENEFVWCKFHYKVRFFSYYIASMKF